MIFSFGTDLILCDMGFVKCILCGKMGLFYGYFRFTVSSVILTLLGFFVKLILRYNNVSEGESVMDDVAEPKIEISQFIEESQDADVEEQEPETPKFFFKFQFQSSGIVEQASASTILSKYEFTADKSFSHFLEDEEPSNHSVNEFYVEPNHCQFGKEGVSDSWILAHDDFFLENNNEAETANYSVEGVEEKPESISLREQSSSGQGQGIESDEEELCEGRFLDDHDFVGIGEAKSRTANPEDEFGEGRFFDDHNLTREFIDSVAAERFLSDKDFERTVRWNAMDDSSDENNITSDNDIHLGPTFSDIFDVSYQPEGFDEEDRDKMKELREFVANTGNRLEDNSGVCENHIGGNLTLHPEDSNALETLWEHQDLIEQLKMELKRVKATGLPTILEESEYPKVMEHLNPWKMDEEIQHNGRMNELPKFYRSYRERMRKFDILNYQKMYALGYFQSRDSFQSHSTNRYFPSAWITSILPHTFRPSRLNKTEADSMKKLIGELQSDLERVYVGQLCLSWEFLQWQYFKALELWENDTYLSRRYNQVAGEFQQFQVLLQRFMENEPFQGPRMESYAKNRYRMRYLLQVPVIREDNVKDRKKKRRKGRDKDAITSDMLIEILEESIRTIWQFIRADKDAHNSNLKSPIETFTQKLQNPTDLELVKEIQLELQKKEKRLRGRSRSGHCILKKFQKNEEEEVENFLDFFSQVDMKLICRVLNMSRLTTEQVQWCDTKLRSINFKNKTMHAEPSFSLFPY